MKIVLYPVEYLGEAYIHPRTMRKSEAAQLLDLPWQVIKTTIREEEELAELLLLFHYKPSLKYLYQIHVAILFLHFGPPLATARNREIWHRIEVNLELQCA